MSDLQIAKNRTKAWIHWVEQEKQCEHLGMENSRLDRLLMANDLKLIIEETQKLRALAKQMAEAFEEIKRVTGTSTLQWHIADKTLNLWREFENE